MPAPTTTTVDSAGLVHLVVGTAGHIDHGKSALVERLTGFHPDTLPEEQERGLTINLGYATFVLADGRRVGMIDVPGHERFVKNMLAGATAMHLVILVVAADDGVMPQTREHLAILQLLGIRRGVIALTKIDMVEPEMAELAAEDVRDLVKGTFLERAPLCPVSSITGQGIPELKATIERELLGLETTASEGPFRMPIQRAFSAKGYGTIVTGVAITGAVSIGDTVEILPAGTRSRVRGVEAYGLKLSRAESGHRAALNLADIDYHAVGRGQVVVQPGHFVPATLVEVRLRCLGDHKRPLESYTDVRLHVGTSEALGTLVVLDRDDIPPGEEGLAQLRLEEPVVVSPGDRFVLRMPSPMVTIGGGIVLGISRSKLKRLKPWVVETLRGKEAHLHDPRGYLEQLVLAAGPMPVPVRSLPGQINRSLDATNRLLSELEGEGKLVRVGRSGDLVHRRSLDELVDAGAAALTELHAKHPLRLYLDRSLLRALPRFEALEMEVFQAVTDALVARGKATAAADGRLRAAGAEVRLSDRQRKLVQEIAERYLENPYATPSAVEVRGLVKGGAEEVDRAIEHLLDEGTLVRVGGDVLFHRDAVERARESLLAWLREKGELQSADFKSVLDSTRKYVIPLLEYFDEQGLTIRDGNRRVLRDASSK
ncbi:MAG: selenocysteine-specific translation elongation factor [Planctomycetes bacterium]|nr:selenocysteine-specific translation elongation factor [Planctomycetota bacterium]MBI3844537.1 selenocysteine-specific translation elongation factor [Planctomycetota bacterium]